MRMHYAPWTPYINSRKCEGFYFEHCIQSPRVNFMLFKSTYFSTISPLFSHSSSPIMGVASSPLWGPSSCILSTAIILFMCWNRMCPFYNILSHSNGPNRFREVSTNFNQAYRKLWGSHPARFGDRVRVSYLLLSCLLSSGIGCVIFTI